MYTLVTHASQIFSCAKCPKQIRKPKLGQIDHITNISSSLSHSLKAALTSTLIKTHLLQV